jgi:hypothetical protein
MWEPSAPLYINAQDAAFTIRELATPPSRSAPSDVYESLLQSALQVGLTTQEMQDFVRRAMREFGYSNARSIPRVGRMDRVTAVVGFIECWSALQAQSKPGTAAGGAFTAHQALVVNHSDGGFLLRFELKQPLLSVGSLICLRGNDAEPWTVAAIRWLEDTHGVVMAGCEVFCNFGEAKIGQAGESARHTPLVSYERDNMSWVLTPFGQSESAGVQQITVDDQNWVVSTAAEMGEDWQLSSVLDVAEAGGSRR